jgi:hypothetical protein
MYPWMFWLWAPQVHFPWSGDVRQRIEPDINGFFSGIKASAGNSEVERKAFEYATYGKQLGLVTNLLLDIAEQQKPVGEKAIKAKEKLAEIKDHIETLKIQATSASVDNLVGQLQYLKNSSEPDYERVKVKLRALLNQ